MMATAEPPSTSSFLPLLESLEDGAAGQSEKTDAYLTIANRLSGEEGRQFLPAVEKHFSRLGEAILAHISSPNAELSQAALQALGFCVYHSHVVSGVSETFAADILSALCSLVTKSTDKNTCTRALWVISKQSFHQDVVSKKVPAVLSSLESVWTREDIQSVVMEHEALNVIIRMLEQVPTQMGERAVQWAKLIVPLVVHSASKVRLRAAAAMEMGMPLLLAKQMEVAAIMEPMMSSKLIPELQKLFMSKNETNVLKLWPLFVKLLGKLLHRGGPFINSLLHLEELGFRSSSPTIKKIAFIAWKSLIDNFALNPDILCSAKRVKLLMQPLTSIHVRTEALLLTKVEVWWYLVVQLGPNLSSNFDQVSVPLLQSTIGSDSSSPSVPGTPSRPVTQNGAVAPSTPKSAGSSSFNTSAGTPRMSLNSSLQLPSTFPSIQLLGLEMLLHYFLGPEVVSAAAKNKLVLVLEPLNHPLLSGSSSFTKHAAALVSNVRDGFTSVGKDAPESLLAVLWTHLVRFVSLTIESAGSKKDRQGCEALTLMLKALQSIVTSEALPADRVLVLFEATVKGIPQRVLSSASYQVGKMDVLNGTPALFLILLLFNSSMLPAFIEDERFFRCLQTLVGCGLSGPASPLAFAEAVLGAVGHSAGSLQNKEQLWRMWSAVVGPLTDTITQTNEVNQGDALEHNFSAMHCALMFPVTHLLRGSPLPQAAQKAMMSSWSKLYKVFARCSALVVTAEENICCEELCAKMAAALDREALAAPSTLNAVSSVLQVMVECVDFSPYTPHFQQKLKSPHTPVNWTRKRNKALGNLTTFQSLLVQCLEVYLDAPEAPCEATGCALVSILSALFANVVLSNAVREALTALIQPLTLFYKQAAGETAGFSSQLLGKLEKLLGDVLGCLQTRSSLAFDDELLALLSPLLCVAFPHKKKNLRATVTQFWNATFANAAGLTYPEEIRPILSQVKQKTPIILPGFEAVSVPDELSEPYSSESSQLETKLSGMPVTSAGKRDSLMEKAAEKDRSSTKSPKPVSTKLDFGSPKPPRRNFLEEEASIDFVFIPPETKERVLTEHQKEVKKTKRVDIPAMYNNLDASLDTTAFSQFTQSQDDTLDKVPAEPAEDATKEAPGEVPQSDEVLTKETQDFASPKDVEKTAENLQEEEVAPDSADVPVQDDAQTDVAEDMESKDDTSPNISASSDLVSGTPQKPNSRRQSFITLEKYAEGKPASPSSVSSFTGPLVKPSTSKSSSAEASQPTTGPNSQDSTQMGKAPESPRRPPESRAKSEPVRLIERLQNDSTEDEDVIPDTQAEEESSQEEESEPGLEDSQSQASPDEPRRSGRQRVRPQLPGEDPDEREAKFTQSKRRRSEEDPKIYSPKTPEGRPNTRSKQPAEGSGRDRLRSRSSRDSSESSQTNSQGRTRKKIKLYSSSEDFLDKPDRKRRSTGELESSQTDIKSDTQSDNESQLQRKRGRPRKGPLETDKEASSQTAKDGDEPNTDSQIITPSPKTESKSKEAEDETEEPKQEEEMVISSSQTDVLPQQKADPQTITASPPVESKDGTIKKSESEETVEEKCNATETMDEQLSQEDSQTRPSSKRRSRRSKTLSEAAESEERGENTDSVGVRRRSQSSAPITSQEEAGGRTRRSKLSKSSSGSTPDSSQSLDVSGSESSQGRGRYSRRRSSPALAAAVESSESESSEVQVSSVVPKRRGRKPRVSLQSPLTLESKPSGDVGKADASPGADIQSLGVKEPSETQGMKDSPQVTGNIQEQSKEELPMETEAAETSEAVETSEALKESEADDTKQGSEAPLNTEPRDSKINDEVVSSQDVEMLKSVSDPVQDQDHPDETSETVQVPAALEDSAAEVSGVWDVDPEEPALESDSDQRELPVAPAEDAAQEAHPQNAMEKLSASTQLTEAEEDAAPLHRKAEVIEAAVGEHSEAALTDACSTPGSSEETIQESPVKRKDQESVTGPDVGQSPSDGRTRGTWSPSASPSTSILKKGQKRPLEVETISPLVKSRRVSFANPIQQQETADDIDRRSPAVRTSSPRRSKGSSIPQPKLVTTPTKGLPILSPRNLNSPVFKSSKKCLISEMSQEPRAVSRDCIFPALVGCSAPVEAVLPQISSTMWSRGFGQLIRARNVKTVGDLSALTPGEIKTLPIRSPKISNVKKALKIYEQQRKGRGVDELKSFDETEMMTSEDAGAPENPEEEERSSAETLATELVDEPSSADVRPEQDATAAQTPDGPEGEQRPEEAPLPAAVEALSCSVTPLELGRCTPQQLVAMHEQLGGVMRRLVVELQARLCGGGKH
ncbi:telomere-associated protein RIF1 [Leuresthes tenuis]|uniref:telomere-associated protein RIF1 n=1 Tax=Leuresthes tenuis TaxID=355514 RepID=UPI003B502D33